MIPYQDMASLMYHSVAVINPSFFEGWSTTVEEVKSYGKKIILSDIEVHREQNPKHAIYFSPENAGELADILWHTWNSYNLSCDEEMKLKAEREFPKRWKNFANSYYKILLDARNTE